MVKVGVTSVQTVRRKNHKPTINTLGTWSEFETSFAEYVKEMSIITLPSHRRRDKKSKITPPELSTSSLGLSVAVVGYAIFATAAGTSVAVDGTNTASHSGHDS